MLQSFLYFMLGIFVSLPLFAQEKLIFAIDVIRHGDRTPLMTSSEMEKIWPQGVGQLTPKGMRQAYDLGKLLRQRYVNQYHLLPKQYDIRTMTVRSSAMPRTMMSAQSILFGLYPLGTGPALDSQNEALPQGLQPIPINTVPLEQDSLLVPNHDQEKYERLLEAYILNSAGWIEKERQLKPHYPAWSKHGGIPIKHLLDVLQVSDRLFIEQLYHVSLPNNLQRKEAEMILDGGKWASLYIANHQKLASITGNDLAQTIKREINLAVEQNRPLKYLLFVAHDTTIEAQLKLLGQTIDDTPPYVSELNYLLFDMGTYYKVSVTYNQKPLFVAKCGGPTCTLSNFTKLFDNNTNITCT